MYDGPTSPNNAYMSLKAGRCAALGLQLQLVWTMRLFRSNPHYFTQNFKIAAKLYKAG